MRKFNYSYVTLEEGVSSQYEDEIFLPGKAVDARYVRSVNAYDNGILLLKHFHCHEKHQTNLKVHMKLESLDTEMMCIKVWHSV